jgi:hypothetical protein
LLRYIFATGRSQAERPAGKVQGKGLEGFWKVTFGGRRYGEDTYGDGDRDSDRFYCGDFRTQSHLTHKRFFQRVINQQRSQLWDSLSVPWSSSFS